MDLNNTNTIKTDIELDDDMDSLLEELNGIDINELTKYILDNYNQNNPRKTVICNKDINVENTVMEPIIEPATANKKKGKQPKKSLAPALLPHICGGNCETNKKHHWICHYKDCVTHGTFGYKNQDNTFPLYCGSHSLLNMEIINAKRCEFEDCVLQPSQGFDGEQARFCDIHKLPGMKNVIRTKCNFEDGCDIIPCFGYLGQGPERCYSHQLPGMTNVRDKKCIHVTIIDGKEIKCTTRPSFAPMGEPAMFCAQHADMGKMTNVKDKLCDYPECKTHATYGIEGQGRTRCANRDHWVDPDNTKLLHGCFCRWNDDTSCCNVLASYGHRGGRPMFCKQHKIKGMKDVKSNMCRVCGETQAVYGPEWGKPATHCAQHGKPLDYEDVKNKRCEHVQEIEVDGTKTYSKCVTHAVFGFLYEKITRCSIHRIKDQVKNPRPRCCVKIDNRNCGGLATYAKKGTIQPTLCETHGRKDPEYTAIALKNCACCGLCCPVVSEKMCMDCFTFNIGNGALLESTIEAYEDNKKGLPKKYVNINDRKETKVGNILRDWEKEPNAMFRLVSWDKPVEDGCSKLRPDFIIEPIGDNFGKMYIIVEVDEHQHASYERSCEVGRMINIYGDIGGKHVVFVRFNPDTYKNKYWKNTNTNDSERIKKLKECLYKIIYTPLKDIYPLSVCYLYYNRFDNIIRIEEVPMFRFTEDWPTERQSLEGTKL